VIRHEPVDLSEILRQADDELDRKVCWWHGELGKQISGKKALGLGLVGELERPFSRTATIPRAAGGPFGSAMWLPGDAVGRPIRPAGLMPA
jgi:hypothetical protein